MLWGVGSIIAGINREFARMLVGIVEFLQKLISVSLFPPAQKWQNLLFQDVRNTAIYMAFFVAICVTAHMIATFGKHESLVGLGRALLGYILLAKLSQYWTVACDWLEQTGTLFAFTVSRAVPDGQGMSLLSQMTLPDPISALLSLALACVLAFMLTGVMFLFPLMFLFTKFTGLIFFALRGAGKRAQSLWDWTLGLLLISTLIGRAVLVFVLDLGILCVKFGPFGQTGYGAMFYTIGSEAMCFLVLFQLVRNAPRIAAGLTGGLVRTVSRVTGRVTSEVKGRVKSTMGSGYKAHASGMSKVANAPIPVRVVKDPVSKGAAVRNVAKDVAKDVGIGLAVKMGTKAAMGVPGAGPFIAMGVHAAGKAATNHFKTSGRFMPDPPPRPQKGTGTGFRSRPRSHPTGSPPPHPPPPHAPSSSPTP